ncbi:G-type lectin S-receptor-like serine/threonine-protein kinase RKS1 [Phragmites australis]|uniref:G-type lectin S-receptor-like serine/threonine-protein kinase RKS1 n=1 Tax=Phragmites australis TaxID=29695 RepID=UPI002D77619F|nr:G-type lectin S-receptor-like serine/threonine-protein kinase RKS1 [Phragmites australis]
MDWSRSTFITAAVLLLLPHLCSPAGDLLSHGESLLPGQTVVSDGGAFALGFFSPSNSTPGRQYIGIWYNNIPVRTVVWVANRDALVIVDEPSGNSSSAPSLALANDSNLVLSDAGGRVVWTTNVTATASSLSSGSTAVLLNTGNLVLRSPNGTTLWQSFDHLTDTLIPGMKVGLRYRTRDGVRIVSWKGPGDPSTGRFSYGLDPDTSLQLLLWNGTRPYWRSTVWTGYMSISKYHATTGTVIYVAVVDSEDEIYTTFSVSDGAPPTRYVVTSTGKFQLLSWSSNASAWTTLLSWPSRACSPYGSCGPYGYCDHTEAAATCKCLDGFEPTSREEWSGGTFSLGCRRSQALAPCGGGDEFLAMPNMKVPDKFVLLGNMNSGNECAAECLRNCSCVAYAYASLRSSSAKGDIARCLVWAGELVDTQMIGALWGVTADTFYLRVPAGRKARTNTLKIALPVLASVLMLTCIFFVWFRKSRDKRRSNESEKKLMPGSERTSSELGEGNRTEDLEFPSIQFSDIVAATNNFSGTCMIGRGGFGKVYKGTLVGGREVAVKRLSKDSEQGIEEFKNEASLIAKLQHRNLVRLLGCCTEGAERLLIYEYLANKGLDAILFDSERKSLLDWPTRFGIIKGVARGLLYLHQDSRLTVIHRDLKASNVLLDAEMRPKIADFGMAKIFGENQQKANTKRVVGTYGYIAPEYQIEGVFSVKSDVYSFGVLLLEIVSGVKISSTDDIMGSPGLVAYAWKLWKDGNTSDLVDSSIAGCVLDQVLLCIQVGLLCVQDDPNARPLMSSVVSILENGSVSLPTPDQPAYLAERGRDKGPGDVENSRNTMTMTVLQGR